MVNMTQAMRAFGATGLFGAGALHAAWAAGSSWPLRDQAALARAVAGTEDLPSAAACATVAALTLGTGIVVAGAGGESRIPVLVRVSTGAALLSRGLVGGAAATRLLGMPEPGPTFRALDARFYRPLCLGLGAAVLFSARARRSAPPAPAEEPQVAVPVQQG